MPFRVSVTEDAERDLEEIGEYIAENDSAGKAVYVLGKLQKTIEGLSNFPKRGSFPKELLDLGIRDFREVYFKPYRVVYKMAGDSVYVLLVADGRRDMRALLTQRLI